MNFSKLDDVVNVGKWTIPPLLSCYQKYKLNKVNIIS